MSTLTTLQRFPRCAVAYESLTALELRGFPFGLPSLAGVMDWHYKVKTWNIDASVDWTYTDDRYGTLVSTLTANFTSNTMLVYPGTSNISDEKSMACPCAVFISGNVGGIYTIYNNAGDEVEEEVESPFGFTMFSLTNAPVAFDILGNYLPRMGFSGRGSLGQSGALWEFPDSVSGGTLTIDGGTPITIWTGAEEVIPPRTWNINNWDVNITPNTYWSFSP